MIKKVCICDLCGNQVNYKSKKIYHIKIKSTSYIDYANEDLWGANKETIDICSTCIDYIKNYIKEKNEKNEKI